MLHTNVFNVLIVLFDTGNKVRGCVMYVVLMLDLATD